MKRDARTYLDDIIESTNLIVRYSNNKTQVDYENDDLLHNAIL